MADIKTSSNPPKTKIFVGRLPENAQSQDLRRLFERYGTVTECDILNRYGFVHMKTEEQAAQAIEGLHNCNFMGSLISVEASTGKRSNREGGPGPRRGGFGGPRGGRGGFGPMRGGMGYGGMRSGPYDRAGPGPYGRPDSFGRPEPYGRPDFDRRPVAPGPVGPGPVPAGPGPVPPAGPGMGGMRNGYGYDDRRDGAYMDRAADYMDRRDRGDAAYGMDRMGMAGYDRGYGDYGARAAAMPASDMYGAGAYREGDRSAYADMRQPYERRDMTQVPAARDGYDRTAMAPAGYDRRDYTAPRMGGGGAADMFSRRTPPPPQPAYSTGYPDMQPRRY